MLWEMIIQNTRVFYEIFLNNDLTELMIDDFVSNSFFYQWEQTIAYNSNEGTDNLIIVFGLVLNITPFILWFNIEYKNCYRLENIWNMKIF